MRTVRMIRTLAPFNAHEFSASVDQELTLEEARARDLVGMRLAVYIDEEPQPEAAPELPQEPEAPRDETSESPELEAAAVKRPYGNATKGEWIAYALSVDPDLTEEAANDMSKVSLMTAYGERL